MIIVKKQNVSNWNYKHICNKCDTELLIEKDDLKYNYYAGDFREPTSEGFSANCVVCSASISVPMNNIPKLIIIEIKKKHK